MKTPSTKTQAPRKRQAPIPNHHGKVNARRPPHVFETSLGFGDWRLMLFSALTGLVVAVLFHRDHHFSSGVAFFNIANRVRDLA